MIHGRMGSLVGRMLLNESPVMCLGGRVERVSDALRCCDASLRRYHLPPLTPALSRKRERGNSGPRKREGGTAGHAIGALARLAVRVRLSDHRRTLRTLAPT